jgi:drug/metabolite transporter (DMT)-like permease
MKIFNLIKNNLALIINSFLFIFTLSEYLICMKYINYTYDYKNTWFNILLNSFFTPFYLLFLFKEVHREKVKTFLKKENLKNLCYPVFNGLLYTIETALLFYTINNLTLSYYTILRTGFIIFNIPFFKYLLNKKITNIYLASCFFLVISYILLIYNYITQNNHNNHDNDNDNKLLISNNNNKLLISNTVIIFLTCLMNSTYNNLIEYSIKKNVFTSIDYQIIFQITYFILIIIPSIYYTILDPPPINGLTIILYFFIGGGLQLYMYNKIYILNTKNNYLPANILLSSLDLLRRIIQLLFSFLFFNELFDIFIIISTLFMGLSSLLLLYEYLKNSKQDEYINHFELEEI